MVKVKCIIKRFDDIEAGTERKQGDIWEVTEERADYLSGNNPQKLKATEIIEIIPEKSIIDGEVSKDLIVENEEVKKEDKKTKKNLTN